MENSASYTPVSDLLLQLLLEELRVVQLQRNRYIQPALLVAQHNLTVVGHIHASYTPVSDLLLQLLLEELRVVQLQRNRYIQPALLVAQHNLTVVGHIHDQQLTRNESGHRRV